MWRRQYLPLCIAKTGDYRKVSVYARALLYIRKIDFIVPRKYVFLTHSVNYWLSLTNYDNGSLVYKAYMQSFSSPSRCHTWASEITNIWHNFRSAIIWNDQGTFQHSCRDAVGGVVYAALKGDEDAMIKMVRGKSL